jgi:hypothetical protein
MALVCKAADTRDLRETFSRIVQKQALRAADPTIDLPLPQGHARRPPKGAAKARRRHLHDVRHGLERDRSS